VTKRVFIKRQCGPCGPVDANGIHRYPSPTEQQHYTWLTNVGAPIPTFYGSLIMHAPDAREVLFLEWLDEIVSDNEPFKALQNDREHFLNYIRAVARLNSLQPAGAYSAALPAPPSHFRNQMTGWETKLSHVWNDAAEGALGEAIRGMCSDHNFTDICRLSNGLKHTVKTMKTGFVHGDLEPFQTGRRVQTGEVVIFDLEDVGFAPRFQDIAICLGAPDDYCPRCLPRNELAKHYLDEYHQRSGEHVTLDELLNETHVLWLCWVLGWIDYTHRDARSSEEDRVLLIKKIKSLIDAAG